MKKLKMKPISRRQREREAFRLKAHIIGGLLTAIGASIITVEQAERRLGKPKGWIASRLNLKAASWNGDGWARDTASIARAFDCRVRVEMVPRELLLTAPHPPETQRGS